MITHVLIGTALGAVIGGSLEKGLNLKTCCSVFKSFPLWGIITGGAIGLVLTLNLGEASPALPQTQHSEEAIVRVSSLSELTTQLQRSPEKALVVFSAPWCPACKRYEPIVKSLAAERALKIRIFFVNVEESLSLAKHFGIERLPTSLIFQNGKEVTRFVGYKSRSKLTKILEE